MVSFFSKRKIITLFCLCVGAIVVFFVTSRSSLATLVSGQCVTLPTSTPDTLVFNKNEITSVRNLVHNGKDIGQIYVKYVDNEHTIFSDLYVVENLEGKNNILYKITQEGFFRLGQNEFTFDAAKIGGFGGYELAFIGNDFFIVQEIGTDLKQHSRLVSVFLDDKTGQFRSTFTIPKIILDVINGTTTKATSHSAM